MKSGDLVSCVATDARNYQRLSQVGMIVDIVTHTETYASSGCKNYIVLTSRGDEYRCWKSNLEVINES